jgi:predicted Zn-ribbon and HTH transcriptional regulator
MTDQSAHTHDDQLRREKRQCPRCGYDIMNPLSDRCPRCFSAVERTETNCGSCTWQGNCEFGHLIHETKK